MLGSRAAEQLMEEQDEARRRQMALDGDADGDGNHAPYRPRRVMSTPEIARLSKADDAFRQRVSLAEAAYLQDHSVPFQVT